MKVIFLTFVTGFNLVQVLIGWTSAVVFGIFECWFWLQLVFVAVWRAHTTEDCEAVLV